MNSSDRQHAPDQELESLKRGFDAALPQVARLLPHQGPIEVFIHQNTLHCLESLRFWDALEVGSKIFGAQSAMSEAAALQAFQRGRITKRDLLSCLMEQGEDRTIFPGILLSQLRLALFRAAQPVDRASSIIWLS